VPRSSVLLLPALALALGCSAIPVARRSAYHPSDADLSITRIVHGAAIVDLGHTRLLVDPWFNSGFVIRQAEPLGLTPDDLPPVAAVLLTHGHGDHFDERALRQLASSVPIAIAPLNLHQRLVALGFGHTVDLAWWDRAEVEGLSITAVPARHAVPENGYVVEREGVQVYVAGDTRWFPELVDVATRFPHVDVALLPVGGERLLGFHREMGPSDAARAAKLFDPRFVIPLGYGKRGGFPFRWFASQPTERFIAECKERGFPAERVIVLQPGESWHYYR
jgi:L-ascorbate metabolism protein UlaG (beta-lactamase superfamily)